MNKEVKTQLTNKGLLFDMQIEHSIGVEQRDNFTKEIEQVIHKYYAMNLSREVGRKSDNQEDAMLLGLYESFISYFDLLNVGGDK